MSDPHLTNALTTPVATEFRIPSEFAEQLRRLSHDLSNALEVILQTNYLLAMPGAQTGEDGAKWREMLDRGVMQATLINRQMRDYIRDHS